jgi:hypothetical protein
MDNFFPQKGHLLDKGRMTSFIDLSLIILLIIFSQFSHLTSTIKTNVCFEYDIT